MQILFHVGRYFWMLRKVFSRPERHKLYLRQLFHEFEALGVNSAGIVVIISLFIGGILTIQLAYNLMNPLYPKTLIGLGTRDTLILEFSSTIIGLILAGKDRIKHYI
jgi:phospholipid/cholesterol/gamma-HCH transport system permease protein